MGEAIMDYVKEFFDGFFSSIKGFPAIFYLDHQSNESISVPAEPKTENKKRTVLYERARKQEAIRITKQEKEIPRRKSARLMFFQCVCCNLSAVFVAWIIQKACNFGNQNIWTQLVFYISTGFCLLIFIVTRFLSLLWFGDVAKGALNYRTFLGKAALPNVSVASFSDNISDLLFGIVLETFVLLEGLVLYSIPHYWLSNIFGFVVMSQLNSLYSFEYMWITQGFQTNQRIRKIENHWPFHVGFGTLLTLSTSYYDDFLFNGFIFAALFPFFIVSSYIATSPSDKMKRQSLPVFLLPKLVTERVFSFAFSFLGKQTSV
uniref:Etoposide-induced protein 2.4 n=1 Tax=Panagrolaimus sp. JU765 TaxID=591449 RepID=A0AC34RB52_9BILA